MFCSCVYICIYFHFPLFHFSWSTEACVFASFKFLQQGSCGVCFSFFVLFVCLFPELFLQFNKSNTKHGGNKHPHDGTVRDIASLIGYTVLEHHTKEPVKKKIQSPGALSFQIRLKRFPR